MPPQKEGKYIVFQGHLLELFRVCHTFLVLCSNTNVVKGSLLTVTSTCANEHTKKWRSQLMLGGKGAGNVLSCAGILFSGAQVATTLRVLESLNIAMITERMYYYELSVYLLPVVKQVS